jgi:DNA invertase Pin-like site-specific DNA recombinase
MTIETTSARYLVGYARVSTLEQDEALQIDALKSAGCDRLYVDKASGTLERRPALDLMLDQLRTGDTVVVWRLDRLGRSLRHLIEIFSDLDNRGVAVRSLTESIDTATPGGRLIFRVFASLAEFERDLIRERTLAGLAAARARGRNGGRPTVWSEEKLRTAITMYDSGQHDVATIARVLGVSRASVYRGLGRRDSVDRRQQEHDQ